jgi:hypothetical protein
MSENGTGSHSIIGLHVSKHPEEVSVSFSLFVVRIFSWSTGKEMPAIRHVFILAISPRLVKQEI